MRKGSQTRKKVQTVCTEAALFDSAHAAMTFAFRYSGQQYSPSLMAMMMKGPIKSGKGLSGLDGAAQSGIIRALVGRLPANERNMIAARYSSSESERVQAMLQLVVAAMASMGTGCNFRRLADTLVQKYFGFHVHLGDLASDYAMSPPTMTRRWQNVRNWLKQTWDIAEDMAYRELREAGIIP